MQFQLLLNSEIWESVYKNNGTNHTFNFFFTFLNIFKATIKYKGKIKLRNDRNTQGITYLADIKEVYISTVGTVMTHIQVQFTLRTVKSSIML
jgi:hypothetical protein